MKSMLDRIALLRNLFRRHLLWIGLVAVAIPLLFHLYLQYQTLRKLQSTLPTARKVYMRSFLSKALANTSNAFETKAEAILSVPASAYRYRYPPMEKISSDRFDMNDALDLETIWRHFTQNEFRGARLLFVGTVAGPNEPTYSLVRFFDPIGCTFRFWPSKQEIGAAHAASATWMAFPMTHGNPKSFHLSVDERDPSSRIIVKPIVDQDSHLVGVAGLFIDEKVFLDEYLRPEIADILPRWFPEEYSDAIVTMTDKNKTVYFSNQPFQGSSHEVIWESPFIFKDRYLGMKMRTMSEEQWGRKYFFNNLLVSILTGLVLLGGIILALRTASRAMKLSQMKADFVSNVSHELRTPLASIRVFGEFLKLGRVRDAAKTYEYGEYIEMESRRLTQLINNILDFSKIESGQKTYHFESAQIEQVVAETLRTFELVLEQNGFSIAFQPHQHPLPSVKIDSEAIAQALINLLDNAVKYSGDSRKITVELNTANRQIRISVIDYGIGIALDERNKVFEKFYRVGNSLVHDVKGSGLGLSIVKHIVEAHHGKVTVESEVGRGSIFSIHIPADESPFPDLRDDKRGIGSELSTDSA